MGCHTLLQIFPTQGSNPSLLHYRQILYCWATGEASWRGKKFHVLFHLEPSSSFLIGHIVNMGFPSASDVKNLPTTQEAWIWFLGWEDPLEKGMATYSSILAWRIPWTEKPGRLQSTGSQRVRHDWSDWVHLHVFLDKWLVYYYKMLFFIPVIFFILKLPMFEINIAIPALFLLMVYFSAPFTFNL